MAVGKEGVGSAGAGAPGPGGNGWTRALVQRPPRGAAQGEADPLLSGGGGLAGPGAVGLAAQARRAGSAGQGWFQAAEHHRRAVARRAYKVPREAGAGGSAEEPVA